MTLTVTNEEFLKKTGVADRPAVSVAEASRFLGATPARVRAAAENGTLRTEGRKITSNSMYELADFIDRSMSVTELAEFLNISRMTANRIVNNNIIPSNTDWGIRVLRSDARALAYKQRMK